MVPVRDRKPEGRNPTQDLRKLRAQLSGGAQPTLPRPTFRAQPVPTQRAPKSELRCGWCHHVMENIGAGRYVRCGHCQRTVVVPEYIRIVCDRCGQRMRIRPREILAPRLCPTCSKQLAIGTFVLAPRRRQQVRRHRHRHHAPMGTYGDAVWSVLIVGLALLVVMTSLILS